MSDAAAPGRPLRLSVLLVAIVALNAAGLVKGIAGRDALMREIPQLTPALHAVWVTAPVLAILGAIGLWRLRRAGLYLIGLGWLAAVIVDLRLGATYHAILATGLMWLVVIYVRQVREALR